MAKLPTDHQNLPPERLHPAKNPLRSFYNTRPAWPSCRLTPVKVWITGGAGLIGSRLAALLHERSEVRILDNLRGANPRSLSGLNLDMVEASVSIRLRCALRSREWMSFSISPR
jgi:hypothetical protein